MLKRVEVRPICNRMEHDVKRSIVVKVGGSAGDRKCAVTLLLCLRALVFPAGSNIQKLYSIVFGYCKATVRTLPELYSTCMYNVCMIL